MKHWTIEKLCGFLSIPFHKDYAISLRLQAFDQEHNNSRYIFWTQFSLRGIIADWIYRHVAGSGTQLQHFLGNITSNKHYERLFENFQLIKLIPLEQRTSPYVLQGKHLIAQGLIGYLLLNANEERKASFIQHFFITPNQHYLPTTIIVKNDWHRLQYFCNQQNLSKPKIHIESVDELFYCACIVGDRTFTHSSKSYQYAKKKTIKIALKSLINEVADENKASPAFTNLMNLLQTKRKEDAEAMRKARIAAFEEKQKIKAEQKALKQFEIAHKAKVEDEKRRKAKVLAKQKKEKKQSIYRAYSEDEIKNMTTSKRRRLEDLGIIPKK